jgi:hypothetical protein
MAVSTGAAFYIMRRHKGLNFEQAVAAAAWAGLAPFGAVAFVGFKLFILTMVIALISMAAGFPGVERWIQTNWGATLGFVTAIMLFAIAVAYVHGRYRAPYFHDWWMTLSSSAIFVMLGLPFLGFAVLLVVAAIAGVKAMVVG